MSPSDGGKGGRPRKTPAGSRSVHLRLADWVDDGYERWAEEQRAATLGGQAITAQDIMRDILERALRAHLEEKPAPALAPQPSRRAKRAAPRR